MQVQQLSIKVFLEDAGKLKFDPLIPVFHAWIREGRIPDQLLIDVADYRHVPDGPALMVIANEAHYGIDGTEGGWGLFYVRKRDRPGPAQQKIRDALARTVVACDALEREPSLAGSLRFSLDRMLVRVVSRRFAANDAETYESFRPEVEAVLADVFPGATIACSHRGDARNALCVEVALSGERPGIADLARQLSR